MCICVRGISSFRWVEMIKWEKKSDSEENCHVICVKEVSFSSGFFLFVCLFVSF